MRGYRRDAGRSSDSNEYYIDNYRDADRHLRCARYRDTTEDDLTPYMPHQEERPYRDAVAYAAIDAFVELAIDVAQAPTSYIADALARGTRSAFESAKSKIAAVFASIENPRLRLTRFSKSMLQVIKQQTCALSRYRMPRRLSRSTLQ